MILASLSAKQTSNQPETGDGTLICPRVDVSSLTGPSLSLISLPPSPPITSIQWRLTAPTIADPSSCPVRWGLALPLIYRSVQFSLFLPTLSYPHPSFLPPHHSHSFAVLLFRLTQQWQTVAPPKMIASSRAAATMLPLPSAPASTRLSTLRVYPTEQTGWQCLFSILTPV